MVFRFDRKINNKGDIVLFQPILESLRQHVVPDWYHDAKLGIFIHWGLYSVPGWAPPGGDIDQQVRDQGWSAMFANNPYSEWYLNTYRLGDTPWSLILTYPTFLIPFCTWLMMGYFKAIPKELEECARIDGASRFKAMLYIILPVAVPGIMSAGIFAFTLSWNEFIYALVFLSSPEQKTVPVGVISELVRGDVFFWGPLMAGALLGSIPVAIAYSFFVEHYVSGLTGSVKG